MTLCMGGNGHGAVWIALAALYYNDIPCIPNQLALSNLIILAGKVQIR